MATVTLPTIVLRVTEPREFHYAGYQNASDWRTFRTIPGDYPVVFTSISGGVIDTGREVPRHAAHWATIRLGVHALKGGGTNRLLTATSGYSTDYGEEETTHGLQHYAYEFLPWDIEPTRPRDRRVGTVAALDDQGEHWFKHYGGTYVYV